MHQHSWFNRFSKLAARWTGHPLTFLLAVLIIVVWGVTGPVFGFSDTWQLVINTGTTIITFLMVFVIQNTQNRDSAAVQIKLDELIRAIEGAHNSMLNLEELEDEELERIRHRYTHLAEKAKQALECGKRDLGCPELDKEEEAAEAIKAE
jgi:low affinity Fe/Cu permease